ncbi:MAG: alpha-L-fucosidase, partial [Prolixibacteraceae bacterium]|nr:alpha-L-fucosidase [Prolixibacteraceae bacterium]
MKTIFLVFLTFLTVFSSAQNYTTNEQLLKEFQDIKFGMFVHWGPVSLKGTEIGWSRGREVPAEEYDNLYKEFNPTKFNANDWIKTLKDAGM